jgi:hypothetical protein
MQWIFLQDLRSSIRVRYPKEDTGLRFNLAPPSL